MTSALLVVLHVQEHQASLAADALLARHHTLLLQANLVLIFRPGRSGVPPPILECWIGRVFGVGASGMEREGVTFSGLRAEHALVFNTSDAVAAHGTPAAADVPAAWWISKVFGPHSMASVHRRVFGPNAASTDAQRREWLTEVTRLVKQLA